MARNAIESEFWISKMGADGHIVKKFKKKYKFRIDLKWPEMRWNLKENKVAYRSEMAINAIESEFRTSKMADGTHFVKISKKIN